MKQRAVTELLPGLYRIEYTCNVYLVRGPDDCIAIDFGSGAWLGEIKRLGLPPLRHVLLTHHHVEQCAGLLARRPGMAAAQADPRTARHDDASAARAVAAAGPAA